MSIAAAIAKRADIFGQIGKIGLHTMFPDDFELYICAFELVDYQDNVIKYFSFPVLPRQIRISKRNLVNITRTAGGLVDMTDPRFNPVDINIDGNFGRSFKLVINDVFQKEINMAYNKKISKQNLKNIINEYDHLIKTGYGCCKILENIFEESKKMDDGNFRKLYFHNLSFNSLYMVEIENLTFSQSEESNMIWSYSAKMLGISPYLATNTELDRKKLVLKLGASKILQDTLDEFTTKGLDIISKFVKEVTVKGNVENYDSIQNLNNVTNNNKTGDIFKKANSFFNNDYEIIYNYYSGKNNTIPNESINNLVDLKKSLNESLSILEINKDSFNNLEYFDIWDYLNSLKIKLDTLSNSDKWSRSSVYKEDLQNSKLSSYTLSQGEQLENIYDINDYSNILFDNKLLETDYDLKGGTIINDNIPYSNNQIDFSFLEVVDIINKDTIYGKDIDLNFSFNNNDISTVEKKYSLEQSANILISLLKTHNKRNISLGIDKSFVVGTNRSQFTFPVIYRQLVENFSTDSLFKEISILKYTVEQDNIFVEIEIRTITDDIFNTKLSL